MDRKLSSFNNGLEDLQKHKRHSVVHTLTIFSKLTNFSF